MPIARRALLGAGLSAMELTRTRKELLINKQKIARTKTFRTCWNGKPQIQSNPISSLYAPHHMQKYVPSKIWNEMQLIPVECSTSCRFAKQKIENAGKSVRAGLSILKNNHGFEGTRRFTMASNAGARIYVGFWWGCAWLWICIFFSSLSISFFFLWLANFCFENDRKTPTSTEKPPVTVDELQELIKLLAKYIATTKGANLQKIDDCTWPACQVEQIPAWIQETHRTFPSSNWRSPSSNPTWRDHRVESIASHQKWWWGCGSSCQFSSRNCEQIQISERGVHP